MPQKARDKCGATGRMCVCKLLDDLWMKQAQTWTENKIKRMLIRRIDFFRVVWGHKK